MSDTQNCTILIVDDEIVVRDTLRKILSDEGFSVLVAENGNSAIELSEHNDIDIALLDIKLPDISGELVFERIKEFRPKIKTVMMTAYVVEDQVRKAFSEGAYTCLHKPFEINVLLDIIETLKEK